MQIGVCSFMQNLLNTTDEGRNTQWLYLYQNGRYVSIVIVRHVRTNWSCRYCVTLQVCKQPFRHNVTSENRI
jgi:hypothetical protein